MWVQCGSFRSFNPQLPNIKMIDQINKRWEALGAYLEKQFDVDPHVASALYLIAIQEAGAGFVKYPRTRKYEMINEAARLVLSYTGYYIPGEIEGEATLVRNPDIPTYSRMQEDFKLKEGILIYFEKQGLFF